MTYKSDEEIRKDALFQLEWDSRLRRSDIGVTVKKGVVTLTGTVEAMRRNWPRRGPRTMFPACSMSPMTSR